MRLSWHKYRYFPYERELAVREAKTLLKADKLVEIDGEISVTTAHKGEKARRLTYFSGYQNGQGFSQTTQAKLEHSALKSPKRQATRYSVHGLHEYKGKFNPQVVKALLNIFEIDSKHSVLDPFCGSGTTLVECAHIGTTSVGLDINPLAVLIANAKLRALRTPAVELTATLKELESRLKRKKTYTSVDGSDERRGYLESWFEPHILKEIERIRIEIENGAGSNAAVFLVLASNLLRDYSLQDPQDLRIRRRLSAMKDIPFSEAFFDAARKFIERLQVAQPLLGDTPENALALPGSVTDASLKDTGGPFDAAITSPPYAMALPYIDTQRLSLVWLSLLTPQRVRTLEAALIGSREVNGPNHRELAQALLDNAANLPKPEAALCRKLQQSLGAGDGFRRKAVPVLLYRYFRSMLASFNTIKTLVKRSAPFALVVGHNHTVLNGNRFDINTPQHLAHLARHAGWEITELVPLQTYKRFGLHVSNSVDSETLLLLKN